MSRFNNNFMLPIKCRTCKKEFIWTAHRGSETRCSKCIEKAVFKAVEDVQKEIADMDTEEFKSFIEDIEEYEEENGHITILDDEKP